MFVPEAFTAPLKSLPAVVSVMFTRRRRQVRRAPETSTVPLCVMFVPAVTDSVPAALTVPRSIAFVSASVMFVPGRSPHQ